MMHSPLVLEDQVDPRKKEEEKKKLMGNIN